MTEMQVLGPGAYGAMARRQPAAQPSPYRTPSYGSPTPWETAEFGGNPLYGNYKQALPTAGPAPGRPSYNMMNVQAANGNLVRMPMSDQIEFDNLTGTVNTIRDGKVFSRAGTVQTPQGQQRLNAMDLERQAQEAKKAPIAAPQAQAPVFGNTSKKALGYWGVKGY